MSTKVEECREEGDMPRRGAEDMTRRGAEQMARAGAEEKAGPRSVEEVYKAQLDQWEKMSRKQLKEECKVTCAVCDGLVVDPHM